MHYRITDPRLSAPDPSLAMIVDLLCDCATAIDVDFMFAELAPVEGMTWRILVDPDRALRFELSRTRGAFNIRLE